VGYVEDFSKPRTKLGSFFSIQVTLGVVCVADSHTTRERLLGDE
jgi:hypothetical protein